MKIKQKGMLCIILLLILSLPKVSLASVADFERHYDSAQAFLAQSQYSSAIVEFRKALRINYLDNSARIGLINSYLARASYYANQEKNYDKSANDFRSAIFYLKMYPTKEQSIQNSAAMTISSIENLNQCLKVTGFDTSPSSRYAMGEELRALGNFSAASYEFLKASENSNLAGKAYTQIADLMKLLGNEPRSVDYYKLALNSLPTDSLLRMKYARTLDKIGSYDEALVQYNAALANSKGDIEVLYALERIYLKKLAQTPSDADLNANIGAIKQAQGDFESALSYYNKAEQLDPRNVNTRLNVGTLYQQKKDYTKAIKAYDSILTLYPGNVQANLYKAQALSEMGDKPEALKLYEKVLSLEPANMVAKTEIVNVMQDALSPEEFITYFNKHPNLSASLNSVLYDYAYKLHKDNKINDAINAYKTVISYAPDKVDAYVNLGICYAANNDYKNAQNILNLAKSKFPSDSLVTQTLKNIKTDMESITLTNASKYYESKNYKKALELYLSVNPSTKESLLGAAATFQALNNVEKALEYYKQAELSDPKNYEIPYYIGYIYSEQKQWAEAERYLDKSLALKHNTDVENLKKYVVQNIVLDELNSGINLFEQKDYNLAFNKFTNVIEKDPSNAYAYYYRGMIYDERKNITMAISDYLNALKYTKEIPILNYLLAVNYDSEGKAKDAFIYYKNFTELYNNEDEYLIYAKSRLEELKKDAG